MSTWTEEEDELYEFAREIVEEWYSLGIVDDRQYIPLLKLLHAMHNRVYMEYRRDEDR